MNEPAPVPTHAAERGEYYRRIAREHLAPLWEVLGALVPPEPRTPAVPALWRYAAIREHVLEAGRLITAREAERRVLVLENPALAGRSCITPTLFAGLQLILPGEIAPAHRHAQSALRLVLDGEGAYTAVEGERTTMRRGDFIVTPSRTWHDHGNPGASPVVWLDGLDIPLVRFLDAGFMERSPAEFQAPLRPEGDNRARYGCNLLPLDYAPASAEPARLFVYPYGETRAALAQVARTAPDPHFGHKLRFVNPATGASPLPTIGAFAQLLPAGFATRGYRSTDGTVYVCLDGDGTAAIGGQAFEFAANDVFVVPSWHEHRLHARRECLLFCFSDRPVQQALGLWRDERLA